MSSSTLTKRELREQRRAERQAAEAAEAARTTRRRRLGMLGGAAAFAAILVVVAAVVSSSGGATKTPAPAKSTLFAGIPEHDGVLGDPNAPVTVTEFLDLQCPICAEASKTTLPTLVDDYVRTGKVKLQARTLHFIGADSSRAAQAAAGAQQQGKLWPFVEAFYAAQGQENSGYVTDGFLRDVARTAGADPDKVVAATSTQGMAKADAEAGKLGVDSTPTFAVTKNGKTTVVGSGVLDAAALQKALR
jgi:protein-disulfide isomerase